ncbi:NUDIX hydrolase [Pseudonocardiaceae bacterium YIM PH 21723]|nr:NUDIX hydrolase [Pseudonocardiaceae bacterium YIM PH 21723]
MTDVVCLAPGENGGWLVLLIERAGAPFAEHMALPGGYVDRGERFADAAPRELKEETGITADNLRHVDIYDEPYRDPRHQHVISRAFLAVLDTPQPPVAGDDAKRAEWVDVQRLGETRLAFDHRQIITDALALAEPHLARISV